MNIAEAIAVLELSVPDPSRGLPDEVFRYISKTTPLVNVDLLVKDEKGRTLLAWRDDKYCGKGWHIPGGIVRFKETLEERVRKVARYEIGAKVEFDAIPLTVKQGIHKDRDVRSHFISMLYKCFLPGSFTPANTGLAPDVPGYLRWHDSCPRDLLRYHEMYRRYIESAPRGGR